MSRCADGSFNGGYLRNHLTIVIRAGLFLLLVLFSGAIALTTFQNSRALHGQAEQSLENTGLALSTAAEKALRLQADKAEGEVRQIFSDRVVAYALIADGQGTVLFHTNRQLVGTRLSPKQMGPAPSAGKPSGRRTVLGTGLPAYEYDCLLDNPGQGTQMLRLVLNTTSADELVARADRMWWAVGGILILLWTLGVLFERVAMRYAGLQADMERHRQLGMIGQMTAVLAHEIRNALGSVKGAVQLVDEKVPAHDAVKPALSLAIQGTQRIGSLVDDLLMFSREETYRLDEFDLAELVREAACHTLGEWEGSASVDELPRSMVLADREKVYRVLVNGLKNSIESMPDPGRLDISISRQGRWMTVKIADTGTGISPEALPHLFEPFYTTKASGTGLGLAYARKVVEGMHGSISLANRGDGRGAVLSIRLPGGGKEHHG